MTQKQWKMISTIISIIILIVFALYKAFGEQKATNKSNTHSSSKTSQNTSNSSFTGKNFDFFESMKKYPFKYDVYISIKIDWMKTSCLSFAM